MRRVGLTFDVDWAPDFCIEYCAEVCIKSGIKATFFVTHDSPVLKELLAEKSFEVGLHPNFYASSCHGSDLRDVMSFVAELNPCATSWRSHGLFQSSELFALIADEFPRLQTDVSLFHPGVDNLKPFVEYRGTSNRRLVRLPYFWEDDIYAVRPDWNWEGPVCQSEGLAIFDFHPVLVYLNDKDLLSYQSLKAELQHAPLAGATKTNFENHRNKSSLGANSYFLKVVKNWASTEFYTTNEIAAEFLKENE